MTTPTPDKPHSNPLPPGMDVTGRFADAANELLADVQIALERFAAKAFIHTNEPARFDSNDRWEIEHENLDPFLAWIVAVDGVTSKEGARRALYAALLRTIANAVDPDHDFERIADEGGEYPNPLLLPEVIQTLMEQLIDKWMDEVLAAPDNTEPNTNH